MQSIREDGTTVHRELDNIPLKDSSLFRLNDHQLLNDELINFYSAIVNKDPKSTCVVLSTYYFPKFQERNPGEDKELVLKFTNIPKLITSESVNEIDKQVNMDKLMKIDKLLIPFHINRCHWTLGVIDIAQCRLEYYDHLRHSASDEVKEAMITVIDVIRTCDLPHFGQIRMLLQTATPTADWSFINHEDITLQPNSTDCGVYICADIYHISRGYLADVTLEQIPIMRKNMYRLLIGSDHNLEHLLTHAVPLQEEDELDFSGSDSESSGGHHLQCEFKPNRILGSLPNAVNTCHLTAACLTLCWYIDPVVLKQFGNDHDREHSRPPLISIFQHLLCSSPTLMPGKEVAEDLRRMLQTVITQIYGHDQLYQPQCAKESTLKVRDALLQLNRDIFQSQLIGANILTKYSCDQHSLTTKDEVCDTFVFGLQLPSEVLNRTKPCSLQFESLLQHVEQKFESSTWRCSEGCPGDSSSAMQQVLGPPPRVLSVHVNRTIKGKKNRTSLKIPDTFSLEVVSDKKFVTNAGEDRHLQVYTYRVVSVVLHSDSTRMALDTDEEVTDVSESVKGAHYVTCTISEKNTEGNNSYFLYDDMQFPTVQRVDSDWLHTRGGCVVMVTGVQTAALTSAPNLIVENETTQRNLSFDGLSGEDSEKTQIDDIYMRCLPLTKLRKAVTDILFRQVRCFFINRFQDTEKIPDFFTQQHDYKSRMQDLENNPKKLIDLFGPQAIKIMWDLAVLRIYSRSSNLDEIDLITEVPPIKQTGQCRSILRECTLKSHKCAGDESCCEYIFRPLFPFSPGGVEEETYSKAVGENWKTHYTKVIYRTSNGAIGFVYWLGPTIDVNNKDFKLQCPSNLLAVLADQERILYAVLPDEKKNLWQEEDGTLDPPGEFPLSFPFEKTPHAFSRMKKTWSEVESDASRLKRLGQNASVIETNLGTVYKLSQAVLSVVEFRPLDAHCYLTNGRRGSLLVSTVLGNKVCVAFEQDENVWEESVRLVEELRKKTGLAVQPPIHIIHGNVVHVKSFEGFTGASLYVGQQRAKRPPNYDNTIKNLVSTQSLIYFWDAMLDGNLFHSLVPKHLHKQWYVKRVSNCKQENNAHSFYLWFKKMEYWPENLAINTIQKLPEQVRTWIDSARSGIIRGQALVNPEIIDHKSDLPKTVSTTNRPIRLRGTQVAKNAAKIATDKVNTDDDVQEKIQNLTQQNKNKDVEIEDLKKKLKTPVQIPIAVPPKANTKKVLPQSTVSTEKIAALTKQVDMLTSEQKKKNDQSDLLAQQTKELENLKKNVQLLETQVQANDLVPHSPPTTNTRRSRGRTPMTQVQQHVSPEHDTNHAIHQSLLKTVEKLTETASKSRPEHFNKAEIENLNSKVDRLTEKLTDTFSKPNSEHDNRIEILSLVQKVERLTEAFSKPSPEHDKTQLEGLATKVENLNNSMSSLPDIKKMLKEGFKEQENAVLNSAILKAIKDSKSEIKGELSTSFSNMNKDTMIDHANDKAALLKQFFDHILPLVPKLGKDNVTVPLPVAELPTVPHPFQPMDAGSEKRKKTRRRSPSSSSEPYSSSPKNRRHRRRRYMKRSRSRKRSRSQSQSRERARKRERRSRSRSHRTYRDRSRSSRSNRKYRSRSREVDRSANQKVPVRLTDTPVREWDTIMVGQFLRDNQFPEDVVKAFQQKKIHGKVLKKLTSDTIGDIRVQKGEELFDVNQIESILETIRSIQN